MKPALLVIDVQKAFIGSENAESFQSAIQQINAAIALFREKEYPVIAIQQTTPQDNLVPGVEGFDLPDSLAIEPSDIHIHKTYTNSFNKTPLAQNLVELGVDTVVVTGFSAAFCVLSGYRGAEDADLKPVLLRGAIASSVPEQITFVESISDTISLGALKKMLA